MRRTLAICDRWPWPVRSGGQHRLASTLRALSEVGDLEICILSRGLGVADDARAATSAALPTAHVVEVRPVERRGRLIAFLRSRRWPWWQPWGHIDYPEVRASLRAATGQDRFDVVWSYTTRGAPLLGGWGASVRVLDLPELVDVMRRRRAALAPGGYVNALRWRYREGVSARAFRHVQKRACAQASLVTVCSEIDRSALGCGARVVVVPNGYELLREPAGRPDTAGPATLLFQGSINYYPNTDAVIFFARDVLPLIRQRIPHAQFRVVGRAGRDVLSLSGTEGVVIVGEVDRIEDELAKAHAVVVPLRVASGTRLKILEAWAHGIPVVSTTVGAEGLPVSHAEELLLADSAPELADACIRVLTDASLRRRLAETGRRTVESTFARGEIQARLVATIRRELEVQGGGSTPSDRRSD